MGGAWRHTGLQLITAVTSLSACSPSACPSLAFCEGVGREMCGARTQAWQLLFLSPLIGFVLLSTASPAIRVHFFTRSPTNRHTHWWRGWRSQAVVRHFVLLTRCKLIIQHYLSCRRSDWGERRVGGPDLADLPARAPFVSWMTTVGGGESMHRHRSQTAISGTLRANPRKMNT